MDYTHLTDEEVTYELALRHVVNLGPTTHRGKVLRLKALMQEEALRDNQPTSSAHVMSPQSNIEHCETQIQQLHISTEAAIRTADRAAISQSRTRLTHYRDRLRLIHPPVELRDLHGMLTMHVTVLLNKVNGTSVVSCVQRGDNEVNHTSSTGAIRRSNNEEEGAVGGTADATIPVGNHSNQESTPPPASQPPSMTSFSGGQGRGLLFSSSFRARDNEDAGETQPRQRNTSPPPPYLPRERETWNRTARETQSREVHELQSRIVEMQEREQRMHEEYCRMRDDLERLIRRDRPATERADDRRIQKAVHNWPFKFRGEKDTTSLNVFLDRVETFARSEGMSDATLLSSIKHLLQEDAIDWYSRATSQNLLRTWDQFKREIRREFLPSGYSQILRLEASFRFQGREESFAKFYRDISALFRFVDPPIPDDEKFFLVKKNMNENYAAIVTAARPRSLEEMVDVCTGYDETRMLLNRQRRIPIPHSALLEPNFATPVTTSRPPPIQHHQQPQRFNRVHAVEVEEGAFEHEAAEEGPEDNWQHNIDELVEQVNALKLNLERRPSRPSFAARDERQPRPTDRYNRTEADVLRAARQYTREAQTPAQQQRPQTASYQTRLSQQQQEQPQRAQGWHARQWMPSSDQSDNNRGSQRMLPEPARQREDRQIQQEEAPNGQRIAMLCWNCDEEGHRFMDCPKPQAILFCYRCGRKGYSLRSCFTCRMDAVNYQAENQQ
ncbi:uncharacterized protein LOC109421856 [Aedes albopictus]|uniref:CCHC-type domain-containing protein n=1 Tax=Aedes albopictus TaxID=7160 RepID=A0ABM1XLN9_AEDAL